MHRDCQVQILYFWKKSFRHEEILSIDQNLRPHHATPSATTPCTDTRAHSVPKLHLLGFDVQHGLVSRRKDKKFHGVEFLVTENWTRNLTLWFLILVGCTT